MTEPVLTAASCAPVPDFMERCLNCEAALRGRFCAECGQRVMPPRPSMRELASEAWDQVVSLDGKVATTLRLLITRPGFLTVEALAGRRARYIGVVRLYLLCSLVFFGASSLIGERTDARAGRGRKTDAAAAAPVAPVARTSPDPCLSTATGFEGWSDAQDCKLERDPEYTREAMRETLPRMMFILLPAFAAILALAFPRHAYIEHLYFALHAHAFAFLAFVLVEATDLSASTRDDAWIDPALFTVVALYTIIALRRVYRRSWLATVVRAAVISGVYLFGALIALVIAFGIVVMTM